MQNNFKGNSIETAIVIDAQDAISGVIIEHDYVDRLIDSMDTNVESIEQNLIIEDGRQIDQIVIKLQDGSERIFFFDVTSYFGKM